MNTLQVSKSVFFLAVTCLLFTGIKSQEKQEDKINAATGVLKDFSQMKESIPAELMKITHGIIIIPKLINAGLGVGVKRGKGIAMVKLENGTWSNPVFVTMTGGSAGLQAGFQAVDLVLIFKKRETLEKIGKGSFTIGGDISATAGPVGRNSTASTDYKLDAEIYSYSRSKGLFAGISLNGSVIDIDEKGNEAFYGKNEDAKTLFSNSTENTSAPVKEMKGELVNLNK
jgi:lipid-binding SYLF domain-containing protein